LRLEEKSSHTTYGKGYPEDMVRPSYPVGIMLPRTNKCWGESVEADNRKNDFLPGKTRYLRKVLKKANKKLRAKTI